MNRLILLATTMLLALAPAPACRAAESADGGVRHLMYVCLNKTIGVFDIDHDHKLVKQIPVSGDAVDPGEPKGVKGPGNFGGVCASPITGRIYVSYVPTDELICIDLQTDKVLWHRKYGKRVDSQVITPDGRRIYLPCRNDGHCYVIDAMTGDQIAAVETGSHPHNAHANREGTRVYVESLSDKSLFVIDVATNKVDTLGPFTNIIRPFSLAEDEKHVYCCVNGLLGFEVGDIAERKMIARVEAKTPPERMAQLGKVGIPHGVPSHGIGLTPDQKEIWVADGAYGYVDAFDVTVMPPTHVATVAIFDDPKERPEPSWISFSLDGRYCYVPGNAIVDAREKKVVGRMPVSEKMIEIDFDSGKPVKAASRMW
jgi:DNA-binding beta-propeller fold protein YncE